MPQLGFKTTPKTFIQKSFNVPCYTKLINALEYHNVFLASLLYHFVHVMSRNNRFSLDAATFALENDVDANAVRYSMAAFLSAGVLIIEDEDISSTYSLHSQLACHFRSERKLEHVGSMEFEIDKLKSVFEILKIANNRKTNIVTLQRFAERELKRLRSS